VANLEELHTCGLAISNQPARLAADVLVRRTSRVCENREVSASTDFRVHLIDGTYELFRQHYGQAGKHDDESPFAATVGVLTSTLQLLAQGATHLAVASDHIIESFRNDLWAGYKSSAGMAEELLVQIPLMEQSLIAMGVTTWAMVEYEADDALGAAAMVADADPTVGRVLIVTPDKDLGQCVRGTRVVQYDRRKDEIIDEAGVIAKFGIGPASIPDYLGLVGDSADGFPGLPGWGAKGASTVLAKFGHIEAIPADAADWHINGLRGAEKLAATLRDQLDAALLFRLIATVVTDIDVGTVDEWRWRGPTEEFASFATDLGAPQLAERAQRLAASR
jgi:5'-3' exonuclease